MERRFAVRYEELMAEAEVKPEALEGVLGRLKEFVRPFAASLEHAAQRSHLEEYVTGLVSNVKRKNIETIAYLHEQDRQPLQKFIGQNPHHQTLALLATWFLTQEKRRGEKGGALLVGPAATNHPGATAA